MYLITDSKVTVNTLGLTNDEIKECINENLRVNPDDDVLAYSLDWTSWVICNGYLKRKKKILHLISLIIIILKIEFRLFISIIVK